MFIWVFKQTKNKPIGEQAAKLQNRFVASMDDSASHPEDDNRSSMKGAEPQTAPLMQTWLDPEDLGNLGLSFALIWKLKVLREEYWIFTGSNVFDTVVSDVACSDQFKITGKDEVINVSATLPVHRLLRLIYLHHLCFWILLMMVFTCSLLWILLLQLRPKLSVEGKDQWFKG